ncbi:MAG: AAA family ATPase, partial [Anaerolineae bacterium]|nr:AAA family ATPase [Anaerolineae bacterium]
KHCIGLTFNIDDYVFLQDSQPRPLLAHLYEHFRKYDLIVTYSLSRGIVIYESDGEKEGSFKRYSGLSVQDSQRTNQDQPISSSLILRGLDRLVRQNSLRVMLIFDYAYHITPCTQPGLSGISSEDQLASVELLHAWSLDRYLNTKTENIIIALLREGYYHELLKEWWKIIQIPMPSYDDMRAFYVFLDTLHKKGREEFAALATGLAPDETARVSSGLRLRTIEELSRTLAVQKEPISLARIKREKAREIQRLCGDVLEVLETNVTLDDVAGLEYIKQFYGQIVAQVRRGSQNIPRAFLLAGPPGNGKSFQIRALANALEWNCVMMRTIRSMWVGASEQNLERVLNAIVSLRPCVVFIDEVDQMLGQRGQGGDAGTSERMLARLWEFMALEEHRGQVIFATASNRPSILDVATVDRLSIVIPILQPTSSELTVILPNLAKQINRTFDKHVKLPEIAKLLRLKQLSTRQCLDVVSMAALINDQKSRPGSPITHESLLSAAHNFRSNHNPFQIELTVLQAIRMTSFRDFLPWSVDAAHYEFPEYLRAVINDQYEVDIPALERRLDELRRQIAFTRAMG